MLALGGAAAAQMPGKMTTYVQAEKATTGRDQIVRKSIGRTEAIRLVTVRAAVEGRLTRVHFQEGAIVREGDLLLEIDPKPLVTPPYMPAVFDALEIDGL